MIDEQPHGSALREIGLDCVCRGCRERRKSPHRFTGESEWLPTRHEKTYARGFRSNVANRLSRLEDVFEVVEHEQALPWPESLTQLASVDQPERRRDRRNHKRRIVDPGQIDEVDAVGEIVDYSCRGRDRKPRFSATAGTRERDDLALTHERCDLRHLAFAANESRGLDRKVRVLKRLVLPVFSHRLAVSSRFSSSLRRSEEAEAVLKEIMKTVSVPL